MIHTLPDLLFWKGDLHPVIERQRATMLEEIELLDKAAVLENDLDNLAAGYAIKAQTPPPPYLVGGVKIPQNLARQDLLSRRR